MLKKKKIQHSSHSKLYSNQKPLPLSRLQEIAQLERQLISIIGFKNIEIDQDEDLFERLQSIYLQNLQTQSLGLQVLEKIIWLMGEADAPAKIKMIYLLAHENYLQGVNPIPILQEGFYSSLNFKHKVVSGYRCGLVLAELSQCSRIVESTINSLAVSLEDEIGFRPQGLRRLSKDSGKKSLNQLKSIYIGRNSHKSKSKFNIDCNKLQKLDLSKCLYEVYLIGSLRLQSEAKRRYYQDCLDELGRRLIRENPGISIKQKLQSIESGQTVAKEFQQRIVTPSKSMIKMKKEVFSKTDPLMFERNSQSKTGHTKTFSEVNQHQTQSCQVSPLHFTRNTNSSQHRSSKFKLQLKQNLQNSRPNTSKSSSRSKKSLKNLKDEKENMRNSCKLASQLTKQTNIILKFDRLQHKAHEGKTEIRKRKIKRDSEHWKESKNPSMIGNVINLSIIPSVRQQPKEEIGCQTTSKELVLQNQLKRIESNDVIESLMWIGDEIENGKIDNLLRQGVQWIDQVLINKEVNEEKIQISQKSVKEEIKSSKSSNLSIPSNSASIKDSLKLISNPLDHFPPALDVNETEGQYLGDVSIHENCKVKSKRSQSIKDDISDSQSIEYKIVINNFQEKSKLEPELLPQTLLKSNENSFDVYALIAEEVTQWLEELKVEVVDKNSKKKIKESVGVRFDKEILSSALQEVQQKQDEYSYHQIAGSNDEVRFKKVETIKTQEQSYSFSVEEGLLNFTIKDQTIEDIKATDNSLKQALADQYVTSMFEDIVFQLVPHSTTSKLISNKSNKGSSEFSHLSSKNSQKSLSEPKSHPRSSISDRLFEDEDLNNKFDPIQECVNSDRDDSDLSSELHSSENAESQTPFSNHKSAAKKERSSNFTCSRFAGSKIQQNSVNCVSNLNIIEELIKSIQNTEGRISDREMVHAETLQTGVRSRIHSQKSCKSNKNNKSEIRDSLHHVDISIEAELTEKNHEKIFKFDHWLLPLLKINTDKITLTISSSDCPRKQACREQEVPELLKTELDKLTHIQEEILWFLDKFPKEETSWQRVLEEFQKIQLLPEKIQLATVIVPKQNSDQLVKVRLQYTTSTNQLIAKSIEVNLKTYPISQNLNGTLASLLQKFTPNNIIVKEKDLILSSIWTVISKRQIKLRDKSQNEALNCTFEVFQCYLNQQKAYFYQVKDISGESMSFGQITEELRKKVISNIDMIIGFAIKLSNKKISFTPENINNLLKLL